MAAAEVKPDWSTRSVSWFVTCWIVECPEHGPVAAGSPREMIEASWDHHVHEHHGDTE